MKTCISYYGGKQRLIPEILPLIPPHTQWCEVFAGGAALTFAKPPSQNEVINDIDGRLTNFYWQMKTNFKELQTLIQATMHSEIHYTNAESILEDTNETPVRRAWAYWVRTQMAFSFILGGGFAFGENGCGGNTANKRDNFTDLYEKRMRQIEIFNRDAIELIKLKDNSENTLFYCMPEGEFINVNGKLKKIEEVKEGDILCDSNKIVKLHIRQTTNEELYKIYMMGLGNCFPITLSGNHVVFVYRNNRIDKEKVENLKPKDRVIIKSDNQYKNYIPPIENKKIKKGKRKQIVLNYNLNLIAELLGYYAAEGHHRDGVTFSFNANELEYHARVKFLIENVFNGADATIRKNTPHPSVTVITCGSRTIEEYFKKYLITGLAINKKLSDIVMNWESQYQMQLLRAWLNGDGSIWLDSKISPIKNKTGWKRSGNRNRIKIMGVTTSFELAHQMYLIALRCKLHPSIKIRICKSDYKKTNNGITTCYDVYFTNKEDADKIYGIKTNGRCCKRRHWFSETEMSSPITKIEKIKYTGNMYDLTTSQHQYCLRFNILSHNCDPPYVSSHQGGYKGYTKDNFIELLEALKNIKGKFILSSYPEPELFTYRKECSWKNKDIEQIVSVTGKREEPKYKTECITWNYELPNKQLDLF